MRITIKMSLSCPCRKGYVCDEQSTTEHNFTEHRPPCSVDAQPCGPYACCKAGAASSCGFDGVISQRSKTLRNEYYLKLSSNQANHRTMHRSFEKMFPVMRCLSQPFCAQSSHSRRSIIYSVCRMHCLYFQFVLFFIHPPPAQLRLLGRFYLSRIAILLICWLGFNSKGTSALFFHGTKVLAYPCFLLSPLCP